ncbi:hypothetical protein EUX98_g358 [Antrodiella citrinella]|uniref:Ribosomal protein S11 n=1 Tax=Antrodiella citrinella TaxID=2447956 RepID=A0A4S4N471_9APHY|nr:hypothetical protein EUX98_g358 [Antrodiella citrinella]
MLRLQALRIPPAARCVQQRLWAAPMSSLHGMPEGTTLDPPAQKSEQPASTPTEQQTGMAAMGQLFAHSLQQQMDKDPALQEWDRTRPAPPFAPDSAYPKPINPVKASQDGGESRIAQVPFTHWGLHVKCTRNNTIATVSNPAGEGVKTFSGGICGFKGNRRSSYEAGYMCATKAIEYLQTVKEKDPRSVRVNLYLKGFGQGRDATHKALLAAEGEVVRKSITSITDKTPMKIGGTRAKKKRRL